MSFQPYLNNRTTLIASAVVVVPIVYGLLKSYIRRRIIDATTAVYDLEHLGTERAGGRIKGTAVVCGGSIAGLWAARVCADHFEDVLIVEPEEWLATEDGRTYYLDEEGRELENVKQHVRTRVMQFDQSHSYQPFLIDALRKLHPNVEDIMRKSAARIVPPWLSLNFNGHTVQGYFAHRFPDGKYPLTVFANRECMELTLRRLLYQPGGRIRWLVGTVTGLQTSEKDDNMVESVSVRSEDGVQNIPASFVVDCSGQIHAGVKWLQRLQKFQAISLKDYVHVYTTAWYTLGVRYYVPPEMRKRLPLPHPFEETGSVYSYFSLYPDEARGIITTIKDGCRVELSFVSLKTDEELKGGEDYGLPTINTIQEWLQNLKGEKPIESWYLEMIKILQENEPDSVTPYKRYPQNSWVQYHLIKGIPSNFIATGDAVMCLNPRFGQGVTKSCIDALTLNRLLRTIPKSDEPRLPRNFSSDFFKLELKRISGMWNNTKAQDYRLRGTIPVKGENLDENINSFSAGLGQLIRQLVMEGDEDVAFTFWKVRTLIAPGIDMMSPSILWKALWLKVRLMVGLARPLE